MNDLLPNTNRNTSLHSHSSGFLKTILVLSIILMNTHWIAAQNSVHQKKITLEARQVPLIDILEQIKTNYDLNISYSKNIIEENTSITIHAQALPLEKFLNRLLEGTGLSHKQMNGYIVIHQPRNRPHKEDEKIKIITVYDTLVRISYDTLNKTQYDTIIERQTKFDTVICYDTVKVLSANNLKWSLGTGMGVTSPFQSIKTRLNEKNNSRVQKSHTIQSHFPLHFSMNYKKWMLECGLMYTKERYTLDYTIFNTQTDTQQQTKYTEGHWNITITDRYYELDGQDTNWISIKDSAWIAPDTNVITRIDTTNNVQKQSFHNAFECIEIPLVFGYRIPTGKRLNLVIQTGGVAGFILQSHGKVYTETQSPKISSLPVNTFQFTVTGRLYIDFQILNRWHLLGGFLYRRKLTNYLNNSSVPEQKNYFGARLGMRITLNP